MNINFMKIIPVRGSNLGIEVQIIHAMGLCSMGLSLV